MAEKKQKYIEKPQGVLYRVTGQDGSISAEIVWNKNFVPKYNSKFLEAQKVVDNAILRYSEPYIPLITGTLIKSGILGTVVGTGEIIYTAPYSRKVYYDSKPAPRGNGPLRGNRWFERMKADRKEDILNEAQNVISEKIIDIGGEN